MNLFKTIGRKLNPDQLQVRHVMHWESWNENVSVEEAALLQQ